MYRTMLAALALAFSTLTYPFEISWRAESLDQAKELCRLSPSKHILVFYTDYRT